MAVGVVMVVVVVGRVGNMYHVGIWLVAAGLLVPLCRFEVTWICCQKWALSLDITGAIHTNYQGVLWQLLKEAFLGWAVDVEVESLRMAGEKGQTKAQH